MAKSYKKNTAKKKAEPIRYSIARIDLIKQSVDSHVSVDNDSESYSYWFETDINLLADKSIIQVIINYKFYFKQHVLLHMQVENDFKIENFNKVVINNEVEDKIFLAFLVHISIDHTRGMQSIITKEESFHKFYIPPFTQDKILSKIARTTLK